jgi:hypothetical protein
MIFVLIYHLMFFTDEHTDLSVLRDNLGISLIFSTLFLLFVNILIIAIPAIKGAIRSCRVRRLKKIAAKQLGKVKKVSKRKPKVTEDKTTAKAIRINARGD